jgi:transcriptional regulator GlxA family with amidase domain
MMDRRDFVRISLGGAAMAVLATGAVPALARSAAGDRDPSLPNRRKVRVAFMLGDGANVIDTAGPWEVFQDAKVGRRSPFELYTVAATQGVLTMTGGFRAVPHYTVANAPQPNLIVVPAQRSQPALLDWLRRSSGKADITMSVCTGAFQLARAGLLDNVPTTTHHQFWDSFAREFPQIDLRRGPRFVDSGAIATAGGLTSGIDLALHVVKRYFGADVAATTARYMEHDSDAWREGEAAG